MHGRREILTDFAVVTKENIAQVLAESLPVHLLNQRECDKLWQIYRGKTDILNKEKPVRPDVNNMICENRAYEIVAFFNGYEVGEPIQYVHRDTAARKPADRSNTLADVIHNALVSAGLARDAHSDMDEEVSQLNRIMDSAGKQSCDVKLNEWINVAGLGYRMVRSVPGNLVALDSLDPRYTFVVRYSGIGHPVVMAVAMVKRRDLSTEYVCYTPDSVYTVVDNIGGLASANSPFVTPVEGVDVSVEPNPIGRIPIVEYQNNGPKMGSFEIVLDLLNALNTLQSNRMDDVVQTVNSILFISGGKLEQEDYDAVQESKVLQAPDGVKASYLTCQLDGKGTQDFKDDLYQSILTIAGIPNRNAGSGSTSDTGAATYMRDGFLTVEHRAKTHEALWKASEREFLAAALEILRGDKDCNIADLTASDIVIKFTRRNYDNLMTKVQSLDLMLRNDLIHPETAYVTAGVFPDPIDECRKGMQWYEERAAQRKQEEQDEGNQVSELQETSDESGRDRQD